MSGSVVITGLGLITPLGNTPGSTFDALLAGHAITTHGHCSLQDDHDRSPNDPSPIVSCPDAKRNITRANPSLPRVSRLGLIAAKQAIAIAGWTDQELSEAQTGLIIASSRGPADDWISTTVDPSHSGPPPAPPLTSHNLAGRSDAQNTVNPSTPSNWTEWSIDWGIGRVMTDIALGVQHAYGPRWCISAACASGLHAIARAVLELVAGQVRRVLLVGAESSLHPLFLHSFSRLGVLPAPGQLCRPFDQARSGFLMSESAAAICLEIQDHPSPGTVRVAQASLAGDGHHLTAIHPSGRIIEHVLTACTQGQPSVPDSKMTRGGGIDLFHAHGTGTDLNDPIELDAISRFTLGYSRQKMDAHPPAVWSHKAAIGHTLGAAGLVAIVLSSLIHQRGIIPGNIHTTQPLNARGLILSPQPVRKPVRNSICLAAGFGGSAGAVRLETCD